MSKPTKKGAKFSYNTTQELPKLKKIKTEWDLKNLFYKSLTDPKIEEVVAEVEKQYRQFAKKYKTLSYVTTDAALIKSLIDYKKLQDNELDKVFVYLFLLKEKDAKDAKAEQVLNQLQQRVTGFGNETVFYTLAIGKLDKARQKKILNNSIFIEYRKLLTDIFESAKHTLTEAEEKILSLKSMTSRSLWIGGTEKILGNAVIEVSGKEESLNGAMMEMLDAPSNRRHALAKAINTKLQELGPIAENEITALVLDKKINDELRGYKTVVSATTQSFDSTEKTLEVLTDVVTTKGYALSKKYYNLKKKLYGKKVDFIDRDDYPERMPDLPYKDAVTICRDAFFKFNPLYGQIFDEMLIGGHLDVYPQMGKGGGAFCISSTNTPTLIMLNHSSDFGSLRTLAHEMGHAVHAYRSKEQSVLYQDHSTLTAETASTFFEAVVAHELMTQLTDSQKKIYLNALISDKIGTMIMCIARYSAELEIHETVRAAGAITWQEMSAILAKHFRSYCGSAINVQDHDGLSVIAKTHYRRNFYQYSYSFGVIGSSIMFKRCLDNEDYKSKIDDFLVAGEKDTVENIFKSIGINMTKPETLLEGLQLLEDEIKLLEKLSK
jgi:oligoendopeptidase F